MRPTPQQLAWQEAGFGLFFHFGINTFHGVEWGDGTADPATFAPDDLDVTQWVDVAKRAGARYVVLTAKHHDGFCLWPTATTAYSVKSAIWRDGRGDVVAELAAACRDAGLGLGLYLSPWDRNAACYDDPEAYDDLYVAQLTELCTGYGPLFEIWLDGAGSESRTYDWTRIMAVVREHQPHAMVFNLGEPTIRWVGNEDGLATEPVRYTVSATDVSMFTTAVSHLDGQRYLPPECDVPIRADWFWQPSSALKTREQLLEIFDRSMGLGAGLLLNLAPTPGGRLDPADVDRLLEVTGELRRRFARPVPATLSAIPGGFRATFPEPVRFDHLELREELRAGQFINGYAVVADGIKIAAGSSVGIRRWHAVAPVVASSLDIQLATPGSLTAVTAFASAS
ncbi:alpha-L-fucosidase [Hamadaea sp. NPDC051192]|uniref:alpha-L-fucosidase n=1 Tax=Hamadaea sp. NPDC051192 TaxID=3154940 RepID=UPI0034146B2B